MWRAVGYCVPPRPYVVRLQLRRIVVAMEAGAALAQPSSRIVPSRHPQRHTSASHRKLGTIHP